MIHFSLFSGIGGFDFASELMNWTNYLSCEINPFGRKILQFYWPMAYHHDDIKTLNYATIDAELSTRFGKQWRAQKIVLTGGFPCQPYSTAGKQLGNEDERHLWPEMLRAICEIRPDWIVGENVRGLISWNAGLVFDQVRIDLEAAGYVVLPFLLPACAVDAPHRRDRIWFVAHTDSQRHGGWGHNDGQHGAGSVCANKQDKRDQVRGEDPTRGEVTPYPHNDGSHETENGQSDTARNDGGKTGAGPIVKPSGRGSKATGTTPFDSDTINGNFPGSYPSKVSQLKTSVIFGDPPNWNRFPIEPAICIGNDGLPSELDGITISDWRIESIKGAGNAIVPQVALQIFKAIDQMERCAGPNKQSTL